MIYPFAIIILLFIFFYYRIYQSPYNLRKEKVDVDKRPEIKDCQRMPTTQEHAWYSRAFLCPPSNGSYQQCTNNYIPTFEKENCDPMNRTYEMCPYPYAISEKCYYEKTPLSTYEKNIHDQSRVPTVPLHYEPVENPEPNKLVRNGMFFTKREPELLLQNPIYTTPPAPM